MTSVKVCHSQPWLPGITSSNIVRAAPTGGILFCLKKIKGKGMPKVLL